MLMQKIWIVKIPEINSVFTTEMLLKHLPKSLTLRAKRYINTESSLSYSIGRLLLKKALIEAGLPISLLEKIQYSEEGKPALEGYYFSISHGNGCVALIFGTTFSVGIDIEKKKEIDLKLFKYLFTETEWKSITNAENSLGRFYWFWVRKEALLKAAGCTLKDLKHLKVLEQHGIYKGKYYYFESFDFDADFNGIVATEKKIEIEVEFVAIKDLLKE